MRSPGKESSMGGYIFYTVFVLGVFMTYLAGIRYIDGLRGKKDPSSDWVLIGTGLFFGGIVILILYALSSEIRLEDATKHRRLLVFGIVFTVLQVLLAVLLTVFGYLDFGSLTTGDSSSAIAMRR